FKYILFLIVLGLFFSGCSDGLSSDNIVNIGVLAPLDVSVYEFSGIIIEVLNLSVNNINLDGGILGKKINLILIDGKCSKKFGKLGVKELIEKYDVKFIIGGMCSSETLGASSFVDENEVILISPSATSKEITTAGEYVYRLAVSDSLVAEDLARLTIKNGHKKLAIYFEKTDFTESFRNDFVKTYAKLGGEFSVRETFDKNNSDKLTSDVNLLLNSDADSILFLTQTGSSFNEIIYEFKSSGINLPIYTNELILNDDSTKNHLEYINGAYFGTVQSDKTTKKSLELIGIVDSFYGEGFTERLLFHFITSAYDIPYILKYAIEKCNNFNSVCVKNKLDELENYEGYTGNISFDTNGDLNYPITLQSFGVGVVKLEE
ncbi:MAG: ABC transporter substrate-binding protein, partial [Nanoarchaeales archaeon]|nr:ABC transporter substrate-binding protein [Nanoarchaeales archaeon]